MIKVYTIIVTYNAMKWIERCINALSASSMHTEIVVVDNSSTDETVTFVEKAYPYIHVIKNDKNKGFGQANNQGIEYAYKQGATHFFLCNQDLYIKPDTLKKIVDVQDKYGLYVASPLQMNGVFELIDQSFYNVFAKNNNLFVSGLVNSNLSDYYETSYVPAAAWVLSRECIEQIGGFDPIFFHYSEDNNYMHRLIYHKKKIGVIPSALAAHDRGFKGNVKAYNKYGPLSTLISLHANPSINCYRITKERIDVHLIFLRDIFVLFFHLNFKMCFEQLRNYISFWLHFQQIGHSLKTNKRLYHNWLNLD